MDFVLCLNINPKLEEMIVMVNERLYMMEYVQLS